MKQSKMKTKDLIVAGAFLALYIVVSMIPIFALGFIPITFILVPFIVPMIMGPIFSLYVAKVPRFGAILILGIIVGLLANSTGYVPGMILALAFAITAELLAKAGKYQSKRMYAFSYMVFSLTYFTAFLMLYFNREAYMAITESLAGAEFVATLEALIPSWLAYAQVGLGLVGGFIGAKFGQRIMKKHFDNAGIM